MLSCVPPGAPDPKKSNGCSPNNMGHPCNAATGNKFLNERDYAGSGSFPLTITRYYNSSASNQTALGVGWVLSYERALKLTPGKADFKAPDVASLQRADGSVLTFDFSNGTWVSDADVRATLNRSTDVAGNPSEWIFVDLLRDETETYNVAGKLVSIANRAGLTQILSYDSSGRLVSVSDAVGRTLTVAYESGGRIASITDPAGGIYAYSYDTAGNLAGATFPDGATRSYVYEDAHFPNALTGVIDENGSRYVTYAYDGQGRMVREAVAEDAEPPTSPTTQITQRPSPTDSASVARSR